jgi:desulfoferrodoxin (superoxide reductase-like protein)
MKRILFLLTAFFTAAMIYAHSPSDVLITYDASSDIVKVDVKHNLTTSPVQDTAKHFIKTIIFKINGKTVKTDNFNKQDTKYDQYAAYEKYKISKGDKLTVTAICNLLGSKSSSITIK